VIEFVETFKDYGIQNGILEATLEINEAQKKFIFEKIKKLLPNLCGKTI
jgi:UDP-glucose 6-dehydrogenase